MRVLKKLATVVAAAAVATVGLSTTTSAAYASDAGAVIPPPVVRPLTPPCYINQDNLGNKTSVCFTSVTVEQAYGPDAGYFVSSSGYVESVVLGVPRGRVPFTVAKTGASGEAEDFVPYVRWGAPVNVPVPVTFCVGTTCTGGSVSVPTFTVGLVEDGQGVTLCANGLCSVTPRTLHFDSEQLAALVAVNA